MSLPADTDIPRAEPFRHEALIYSGTEDFVKQSSLFIRDGLKRGEPVLVLVVGPKIELLREKLGSDAEEVLFDDMGEVGRNPARIIPVWREFVTTHADRNGRVRGIGEPIWAGRSAEELVESQRHESLINLAFAGAPAWILCPYDRQTLSEEVLEEAHRSHPIVSSDGNIRESLSYRGLAEIGIPFDDPLPEPPSDAEIVPFEEGDLGSIRSLVMSRAVQLGMSRSNAENLVIAVHEATANSVRHAGGRGTLRVWRLGESLVCEVRDSGQIPDAMVGRVRPTPEMRGFGLWMANQLADLVQVRSSSDGSIVRIRMSRD
jgi:anti-sigma regulatory factor (Ser/Thr protein kinase)